MRSKDEIIKNIKVGLGKEDCDLVLNNVKLINVYSKEILETNIYINNKRIVSIDPNTNLHARKEIDCKDMYAYPGLIDSHMHFESTMLSPEALANLIVPFGVTSVFSDMMEIANVAGEKGIEEMLISSKNLPYHMFVEVSSCVPAAPGLETTGDIIDVGSMDRLMQKNESLSMGEIDPAKILSINEDYIQMISNTIKRRKIVNGHAIGRLGHDLNIYASAGILDDHECVTKEEMIQRLRVGMSVFIREGSSERNLDTMIRAILNHNLPIENFMFCTDDKHVDDTLEEGHINYNVKRSIELGMDMIDAIKIASVNAAKHFRIEDEIGSISPGRLADIVISKDLSQKYPDMVFYEGDLVAENGKMLRKIEKREYPAWIKDTVKLLNPIDFKSFSIKSNRENKTMVRVIDLIKDQIINNILIQELDVKKGEIQNNLARDIIKIAVVERYGKNGNIGLGFVRGMGLKKGALAYSMSHDNHNIVVVGENDYDMAKAVNHIEKINGGIAISLDGEIIGEMKLPIGGLMSEKGVEEVESEISALNKIAKDLGCDLKSPFMTLSFIALPVVPKLGLTDLGLVDVLAYKIIDLEV
ncbi:adenine deaminase [Anaerococcus sp. AGMB00486]|uniref:Adenine deaminase n=1 Tax=Anaerococcus faecalis TaxID=2742993 RepID=A0ABX2NCD3_9FIRM|nr:adenine deaminase [Anaerococcus faecalis]NVF12381.1 adenine deaminase [Anaerococcus faecalis]